MATSIFTRLASVLTLSALLSACGGGGNNSTPTTPPAAAACTAAAVVAGQQIGRTLVASDVYNFPAQAGVLDRAFTPITYTNATAAPVVVQVIVSSQRQLDTPAGMAGTTFLNTSVDILDETSHQLVPSAQDTCPDPIAILGAGASATITESFAFNVTVPQGHTFTFTSAASVAQNVGSVGAITLTTTNLDLKVSAI